MVKVVTDANVNEVLSSSKIVMLDFWAPWCGPCRILSCTVDEIAAEWEGRITVAKCNADDFQDIAVQFGIRNLPTLLFFKDGQLVDRLVGALPKSQIEDKLKSI